MRFLNVSKIEIKKKPFCLIAKTIKGYPISFMMDQPIWHYRSPNKQEYLKAKLELEKKLEK